MQKIDIKNIDKKNWKSFRFDEIVFNISERVDPNTTDLEIYVGLEHIDPESIHIKRTGTRNDVKGQKLRCYPGDIIFGRRRAYQRKAALVTFDGFCSAHSLVLRANPDIIDPKLFPFFLHSDLFMHRAVDISVGSLSPTINWGTLKSQEFLLPPKDQQAQIAELLWAMDDVIEKDKNLYKGILKLKKVKLKKFFKNMNNDFVFLKEICKISSGNTAPQDKKYFDRGCYPFIRMQHLNDLEEGKYPVKYDLINQTAIVEKKLKLIKVGQSYSQKVENLLGLKRKPF